MLLLNSEARYFRIELCFIGEPDRIAKVILFEMIVMLEHKAHMHQHVLSFFVTSAGESSNFLEDLKALE